MKIMLKGLTKNEGFYLKKERSTSHSGVYDFWIGYKQDNGDVHEQRITELAYIILKTENNRNTPRKKY
jgi:hypothetical protein